MLSYSSNLRGDGSARDKVEEAVKHTMGERAATAGTKIPGPDANPEAPEQASNPKDAKGSKPKPEKDAKGKKPRAATRP